MYHACTEAHTCCGLQVDAFSFELSTHQHEEATLLLQPFGTLRIDPICRNQNVATACIVLPQPGVGKFGTAGMNYTLGRTVLHEACMFRSSYFSSMQVVNSLTSVYAIDSKFFCFRIMNRSIRLFCGRTQAKPS